MGTTAFDLRLLKPFVVLVREGLHFRPAAERLGIGQPALSRQMSRLQHELGVTLFVRNGQDSVLTPAGTRFLVHARAALERGAALEFDLRRDAAGLSDPRTADRPASALPTFDLRLIPSFVAVAETLHFGHAAELLMLAQPALSRQVARLEQQLDALLFVRSHRAVELTTAGAIALTAGREVLELAERARLAVRSREAPAGHLNVHFRYAGHPVLAQAITSFTAANPQPTVRVIDGGALQPEKAIAAGRADVGVAFGHCVPAGMSYLKFADVEYGVYCLLGDRLAERAEVRWRDLEGQPVLVPTQGVTDEYLTWLRERLLRFAVRVSEVFVSVPRDPSLVSQPLLAGEAVAVAARTELPRGNGLTWVPFEPPEFLEYGLIWDGGSDNELIGPFTQWVAASGCGSVTADYLTA